MRSLEDLCAALDSTGVPWARVQFDPDDRERPSLPFALLLPDETRDVWADGGTYQPVTSYVVQLYERGSSLALEASFERRLEEAGFPCRRGVSQAGGGTVVCSFYADVVGR